MFQAKLIRLNNIIEEEVTVEINNIQIVGFASVCPYKLDINTIYSVNIELTILDDIELVELDNSQYALERIGDGYSYILCGQVCGNCIDVGHGIKIRDDMFNKISYLDGHFIKIKVDRLSIEFI